MAHCCQNRGHLCHMGHCCQKTTRNEDKSIQSGSLYSVWNTQLHCTNPGTSAVLKLSSEERHLLVSLYFSKEANLPCGKLSWKSAEFKVFGHFWKAQPGMLVPTAPTATAWQMLQRSCTPSAQKCAAYWKVKMWQSVKWKRIKKPSLAVGKVDWTVVSVFSISIFHNPDLLYISGLASSFNKVAAEFPACHTGTADLRNLDPSWWQNM